MTTEARLEALAREDKWYLSCGDGVVWAPPFPQWRGAPGFWDEALVYDQAFGPLFAVALLASDGREIPLRRVAWRWRPDAIAVEWETPSGARVRERRYALPGGRLVSAWASGAGGWEALGAAHLVAFSAQPSELMPAESLVERPGGIAFGRRLVDKRGVEIGVEASLRVTALPATVGAHVEVRCAAIRSEGAVAQPHWRLTPFVERWEPEGLRRELRLSGISDRGLAYLAVDLPIADPAIDEVEVRLALRPTEPARERMAPGADTDVDPLLPWREFLDRFPRFTCSDPFLERFYDYRLYGLRLNRLEGGFGNVRHPAIAEGIGAFHEPITYSAQCHVWEMRWAREPVEARGSLLNFALSQKPDGAFHGRLYATNLAGSDFYHANWGDAVLALEAVHPDPAFLARAYDALLLYTRWLDATRDREGCGLYDVVDQYETGQEFMSRYLAVDPNADRYDWENRIRLKGVDVTVYAYALKKALATMTRRLGYAGAEGWDEEAARIGAAILGRLFDPETGFFHDVDPLTQQRTAVKAAVGFYPLLTDLLEPEHVSRLLVHLDDPREFGTPFAVPSSSRDDPLFSAEAEWKGKRHLCPWNGRVWPMTNSHVIEGLIRQWQRGRHDAGAAAGRLLPAFVRMMFHEGDLARPNCHEHYNPLTGHASVYRGIDDYMHSWVNDLLIRGVAGVEPVLGGLRIDPLPMDVEHASLSGARVAGRSLAVTRRGEAVVVEIDGERHETRVGEPLVLAW